MRPVPMNVTSAPMNFAPSISTLPVKQRINTPDSLFMNIMKFLGLGSVFSSILPGMGLAGVFSSLQLSNSIKLFLVGTIVESGRRFWQWVFARFNPKFFITARFSEGDPIHEWIILFLTEKKVWHRSREYLVRYKTSTRRWGVTVDAHAEKTPSELEESIEYLPSLESPQLFRWNGYWVEAFREPPKVLPSATPIMGPPRPVSALRLNMYTLNTNVIKDLIFEAKQHYIESSKQRVIVRSMGADGTGRIDVWNKIKSKTYRPLESIILPDGVLDSIVTDAREFIASEDWYVRAGIPYRRGYLFYGPPGTGKSSTVYALAGELGLEIYTLSLSSDNINDTTLRSAVERIPKRGILLIEDIDCAFPSREDEEEQAMNTAYSFGRPMPLPAPGTVPKRSLVTMSGLLNVLDGVDSEEGRIFMATTNYVDRLDTALLRPGRIDMKIEYKLASQKQATALFNRFFTHPDDDYTSSAEIKPYTGTSQHPLAETFASAVPEDEFTIAELQGYLLSCKTRPEAAVSGILAWILREREERTARENREQKRKEKLLAARQRTKEAYGAEGFASHGAFGMRPQMSGFSHQSATGHHRGPHMAPNQGALPNGTTHRASASRSDGHATVPSHEETKQEAPTAQAPTNIVTQDGNTSTSVASASNGQAKEVNGQVKKGSEAE